jgi:ribosomal protein S18 acetylase RimI-like enzyme
LKLYALSKGAAIPVQITEVQAAELAEYASISIAFEVRVVFDVQEQGDDVSDVVLSERVLGAPYVKDYDSINGDAPEHWPSRFDVSTWGFLVARIDGQRVGGAAIAFDTPGVAMLDGRRDVAVLWDIRVAGEARRAGVGSALFREAEEWARVRGCRRLEIETQNINVPACRFYARQGCTLGAVNRSAYPDLPHEIQLIWFKDLS